MVIGMKRDFSKWTYKQNKDQSNDSRREPTTGLDVDIVTESDALLCLIVEAGILDIPWSQIDNK